MSSTDPSSDRRIDEKEKELAELRAQRDVVDLRGRLIRNDLDRKLDFGASVAEMFRSIDAVVEDAVREEDR